MRAEQMAFQIARASIKGGYDTIQNNKKQGSANKKMNCEGVVLPSTNS